MPPPPRRIACGAWPSPLHAEALAAGAVRFSLPRLDRGVLHWVEGRPADAGRQVLVRATPGSPPEDLSPRSQNVRSRVHEYGGGEYAVRAGTLVFTDFRGGAFRLDRAGVAPLAGADPGSGYADFEISPDGRFVVAIEERPREGSEPENRLVALPLRGDPVGVVAAGHDFVSFPRFAPDGRRLAYTAWDHPEMPWDGTTLHELPFSETGPAGPARKVAGGRAESVFQPCYSPAGRLTFVSDRSGFWNLHQERGDRIVPLCRRPAEFGVPQWGLGLSTYAFVDETTILCVRRESGADHLAYLDVEDGRLRDLALPYSEIGGVRVEGRLACFLAAGPLHGPAVCLLDLRSGAVTEVRARPCGLDPELVSTAEAVEVATEGGATAYAFLFRPRNPACTARSGERPPLVVRCHGGPTAAASPALDLAVQYWTSRGFAVLDVDYGGSTGHGRAYRERLRGAWGVVDVADCVNAGRWAAGEGLADPARLAIRGGSAGGYTALCAMTFHDVFGAGAIHYGISDLEALQRDTHKFESRYLVGLVGRWPEQRARYRERSPLFHAERLSRPVIFFQGLEDRVVPPAQTEAMVAAMARRGVPHAYVAFPGEQHGFRRAESIRTALEGELYFYGRVFGFADVRPAGLRVIGLDAETLR